MFVFYIFLATIIIIVVLLCFIVHLGAKKYVLNLANEETEDVVVYNNY